MEYYDKKSLLKALREIRDRGWIPNARHGNDGGVGNTLEDLLGIKENNIPLANSGEWELKTQRANTTSLVTLMHMEPSPRALRFVPKVFLPKYGWLLSEENKHYSKNEMSFRQTINGKDRSDRGFKVVVDRKERKVLISFDAKAVDPRHKEWLALVKKRVGLGELNPQPYWGFDDLFHKIGVKLVNCVFIIAKVKKEQGWEYFSYDDILLLQKVSLNKIIDAIENGDIYIDFDARTQHNHGTKFRIPKKKIPALYETVTNI